MCLLLEKMKLAQDLRIKNRRTGEIIRHLPERWKLAMDLRSSGKTYREIGEVLNVCSNRAQQIVRQGEGRVYTNKLVAEQMGEIV